MALRTHLPPLHSPPCLALIAGSFSRPSLTASAMNDSLSWRCGNRPLSGCLPACWRRHRTLLKVTKVPPPPYSALLLSTPTHAPAQDDMQLAPDFFPFFEATAPLLDRDPTLYCVSSWNDHGQVGRGWFADSYCQA